MAITNFPLDAGHFSGAKNVHVADGSEAGAKLVGLLNQLAAAVVAADAVAAASAVYEAAGDPSTDHDGVDTAVEGRTFARGNTWVNTTDDGVFVCQDNATGAAVWGEVTFV